MIEHVDSPRGRDSNSRGKKKMVIFVVALLVIVILILFLLSRCSGESEPEPTPSTPGGGVTIGSIDQDKVNTGEKDVQTLLNEQVAEGMFRVFIATHIAVDEEGNMKPLIQNAGRNRYHCWVEIVDKYGTTVYETDVIPPGYKVEEDVMTPLASRGPNECTAVFHLLQGTTKDSGEVNSIEISVNLVQD